MPTPSPEAKASGISIRQYAASRKRRGLPGGTDKNVRKAVSAGRITLNEHGRISSIKEADREWEANRKRPQIAPPNAQPAPDAAAPKRSGKVPALATSLAEKAALEVKLKRIELARKRGAVVDRKLLQDHARRAAQVIQRHALTFHSRVAAPVHGAPDVRAAERILEAEMRILLELVAKELTTLERGRGT